MYQPMKIINKFATVMASYVCEEVKRMYAGESPEQIQITASANDRVATSSRTRVPKKNSKQNTQISSTIHIPNKTQIHKNKRTTKPRKQRVERRKQEVFVTSQQRRDREEKEKKRDEERRERNRNRREEHKKRRDEEDEKERRENKRRKIIKIDDVPKDPKDDLYSQLTSTFVSVGSGYLEWLVKNKIQHTIQVDDPIINALHSTIFPHGRELEAYYNSMSIEPIEVNCFCYL